MSVSNEQHKSALQSAIEGNFSLQLVRLNALAEFCEKIAARNKQLLAWETLRARLVDVTLAMHALPLHDSTLLEIAQWSMPALANGPHTRHRNMAVIDGVKRSIARLRSPE